MGSAYFIVLEKEINGLDSSMDGKALSRHIEALDEAAHGLGIRPLSEFVSIPPEALAELMEGAVDFEPPPLKQFSAEEGLKTVKALLASAASQNERVTTDLKDCERILTAAAAGGAAWHFEFDI